MKVGNGTTLATLLIVPIALFSLPTNAPAQTPRAVVTWEPEALDFTLSVGESATSTVSISSRRTYRNLSVVVPPELQDFVTITPGTFDLNRRSTTDIQLDVSIPAGVNSTITGDLSLVRNFWGRQWPVRRADALQLTVSLQPVDVQVVVHEESGASFHVPIDSVVVYKQEFALIGTPSQAESGLPPLMAFRFLDVPSELSLLSRTEALRRIAESTIGARSILAEMPRDGGIEVTAITFERHHFFVYSPETDRAVMISSGYEGTLESKLFFDALDSLNF